MMNRQILSLVLCAWTLVTPGVFGARGADAAAAVVRGTRPVDPGKARVTFVIHVYNGLIGTLAWAPLREGREVLKAVVDTHRHGLVRGLGFGAVRQRPGGWTDHPILVADSREGFCWAVWDFTPPGGDAPRLRLTFFDGRLVVWGRPASAR